jgi:hypothetical protein
MDEQFFGDVISAIFRMDSAGFRPSRLELTSKELVAG